MQTFIFHGKVAHFTSDNQLLSGGKVLGMFKGLKEAKEYLQSLSLSESLVTEEELLLTTEKIALFLLENGEDKVSPTLIEQYKTLVELKTFYPSDIVLGLREQHEVSPVTGKVEYVLNDGTSVLIDIETNKTINSINGIKENVELLSYMNKSTANFLECINLLLQDN
jgi:hypothetical protein